MIRLPRRRNSTGFPCRQPHVVSLPNAGIADPMQMDLLNGGTARICRMEWIGG